MVDSDQFVQSNRVKGRLATGQWLLLQRETEEPSQENLQRELQICLKFDLTCRTGAYGKMGTLVKSELWALGSILPYPLYRLPWWLSGKESVCQCKRRGFNPWIKKIPWRGNWQPTPVFLPGKSHRQRSLVGYSPWSCKRVRCNLATKQLCSQSAWVCTSSLANFLCPDTRLQNKSFPVII